MPYSSAAGATPEAFGAGIGQAEQGLSRQIESVGNILEKHALTLQNDVNVASANELFVKSTTDLGNLKIDFDSKQGSDKINAYPKYLEDIAEIRKSSLAAAPNAAVAKQFDNDFKRRIGYTIVDGAVGVRNATREYQKNQADAVKVTSLQEIAANSKDDNRFDTELGIGLQKTKEAEDYKGASPEVQAAHEKAFTSSAWSTRLQALSINDPLRARELYTKNKDSMDGITQLKLEPMINQAIINRTVPIASDKIIQEVGSGAMEDRLKRLEGYSEKPYADFKQTSSGYGTRAQPGDENILPEQRQAVYTQRMRNELSSAYQIVDNFAPGLAKGARDALADLTYNAGAAWTTSGLGQAVRAGDMERAKALLPQYNQAGGEVNPALVRRRAEELTWWNNEQGPATSDPAGMASKALDRAREEGAKIFPDDPANQAKYVDTLQSRLTTDLGIMQRTARDMQLQTQNQIYKEIYADPNNPITSLDKLSPQAQALYTAAPYGMQKNIDAAIKRAATQDVPLTAERQSRFDTLRGESINEPDKFMSRNIAEQDLPRPQQSILLKAQADRKALVEKGGRLGASMQSMQPLLNDAGIWQSRTDVGKNAEYNKFAGVFSKALENFEGEKKRPPSDKETREIGQGLLKDIVTGPGAFGGLFGSSHSKAYSAIADKTPIQIDSIEAARALPSGSTFVLNGETRVRK